jgi:hypothetical protein
MVDFRQDVHVSIRSLLARPVFAAVAVLTIALGIGASTALFSVGIACCYGPSPTATASVS